MSSNTGVSASRSLQKMFGRYTPEACWYDFSCVEGKTQITMRENPIFKKKHWLEYAGYGFLAAIFYCILLFFHLRAADYQSLFLLYIGNAVFGVAIFLYNLKLIYRPYEKERTVSMLIAAHLTTAIGTVLSMILATAMIALFQPDAVSSSSTALDAAPPNTQQGRPAGWLLMVLINAFILNFSAGSFVSIISSYAGKINQTRDKPAHLNKHISDGRATNDA